MFAKFKVLFTGRFYHYKALWNCVDTIKFRKADIMVEETLRELEVIASTSLAYKVELLRNKDV